MSVFDMPPDEFRDVLEAASRGAESVLTHEQHQPTPEAQPTNGQQSRLAGWLERVLRAGELVWGGFGVILLVAGGSLIAYMLLFGPIGGGSRPQAPRDPTKDWGKELEDRILRDAAQTSDREKRSGDLQQKIEEKLKGQRKVRVIQQTPSGLKSRTYDPVSGKYEDEP